METVASVPNVDRVNKTQRDMLGAPVEALIYALPPLFVLAAFSLGLL
jgi:hypothetical protein